MRILLIDEDPIFRAIVRKYHNLDLPNLELIELDPRGASVSATLLEWQQFQVVLLGHGDNTFEWLKDLGSSAPFLPIVYFTRTGTEALASRARQMGAYQILRKGDLKGQRLAQIIG